MTFWKQELAGKSQSYLLRAEDCLGKSHVLEKKYFFIALQLKIIVL
jgi:hypothetical protein